MASPMPPPPSYAQAVASRANVVGTAPAVDSDTVIIQESLAGCSSSVWGVPTLRPRQLEVMTKYFDPRLPDWMLAILRTSAGKTHMMRVIGAIERGFVLIFIPLLTLSADVIAKFLCADERYGKVRVFHLDELVKDAPVQYESFLRLCNHLKKDTVHTIFTFLSPHHLINNPRSLAAVLHAAELGTLRTVIMDEVHLHVQHGTSFRSECRALKTKFFKPVFYPTGRQSNVGFLATTATMPAPYVADLVKLTGLKFPPNAIVRGSLDEFEQRDIKMEQIICNKSDYIRLGHQLILDFLSERTGKVVSFCNSKYKSFHYVSEAERKCDEANIDSDAIHIHGSLSKHEKFWRIRLFCGNASDDLEELNLRMLFSTNASNVGIDDKDIVFGIRYEWPRDLPTYFQERGRLARILGTLATFILMADLSSFDFLMRQSLSSESEDHPTSTSELQQQMLGANSVISPLRQNAARATQAARHPSTQTYALKRDGRRRLMTRQVRELLEVI